MPDHYDALETRDPGSRERRQAAALPGIVARAMTAPGWGKHLKGIDTKSVNSRAALAKLPVLRKADLTALQKENPPFGGLNVTAPGQARRLLMSPGPIFEPEGMGKDWWGSARALFAAGFRQTGMAVDLTRDFGLDASALVDVDMGNRRVFPDINIRQLASETRFRRDRSAPTGRLVIVDRPHNVNW